MASNGDEPQFEFISSPLLIDGLMFCAQLSPLWFTFLPVNKDGKEHIPIFAFSLVCLSQTDAFRVDDLANRF